MGDSAEQEPGLEAVEKRRHSADAGEDAQAAVLDETQERVRMPDGNDAKWE